MLDFKIQATRNKIGALDVSQLFYLLVEITPPAEQQRERLPLNLCLVIDRSTSMRGERLDRVKSAAALVIEKMSHDDILSVITYSDRAEVVLPAGKVEKKLKLIAQIKGIMASGSTEIYQGLKAGMKELRKTSFKNHINHLILLTDGHTYGDAEGCLDLATKAAQLGVGFSAFGIGTEWNDQFLDALVSPSSGQSGYIETASQVLNYLQTRIQGLGSLYANDMHLEMKIPDGLRIKYGLKLSPYAQPLSLKENIVKLGTLEGSVPLSFLMECVLDPQEPGTTIEMLMNFYATIPSLNLNHHPFKNSFTLEVVSDPEEANMHPPEALINAVNVLSMYRMNEQIWEEVEEGKLEMATTRLRRLTQRLISSGQTKLAHQAYSEVERLETMGSMSPEGRKKLKYGTRALLSQGFGGISNDSENDS